LTKVDLGFDLITMINDLQNVKYFNDV